MVFIRRERESDAEAVRAVNEEAFGRPDEAGLVQALRSGCPDTLSLVAEEHSRVVGHIMFSPVGVSGNPGLQGMGLAPMAVAPPRQRLGIGTLLVREGIETLSGLSCPFVIVLGHPEFYPRFGFVPALSRGLGTPWPDLPDETFMVLILDETRMAGVGGTVRYRSEFDLVV
jgi:putative acetyltransferase